jgi:hypothetical protein
MKKLLFVMLITIPFNVIGQVKTLEELKKVISSDTFERVCIENGYVPFNQFRKEVILYGVDPLPDPNNLGNYKSSANYWLNQTPNENINYGRKWNFNFKEDHMVFFEEIFNSAKKECKYVDISRFGEVKFVTYDCFPDGKLGFAKNENGGYISFIKYD